MNTKKYLFVKVLKKFRGKVSIFKNTIQSDFIIHQIFALQCKFSKIVIIKLMSGKKPNFSTLLTNAVKASGGAKGATTAQIVSHVRANSKGTSAATVKA